MYAIIFLVFYSGLIWLSYRAGKERAAYGVTLFIVGALGFSIFVHGPDSLLRGDGCTRYSSFADDC